MALNTYDRTKDPIAGRSSFQVARLGSDMSASYSNSTDFTKYFSFVVTSPGDVKFLPVNNDPADPITMTSLPVGYVLPFQIRRIFATGTTATLRTLEKVY